MDAEKLINNIFHELNKILVTTASISKENSYEYNQKSHNTNDRIKYYDLFSKDVRENMAKRLDISEKTLRRIYAEPLRLLNNSKTIFNIANYFSRSYPKMISTFFSGALENESQVETTNINESAILQEIMRLEKEKSRSERRDVARTIHLVLASNSDTNEFNKLNQELTTKNLYNNKDFLNRLHNFIKNDTLQ